MTVGTVDERRVKLKKHRDKMVAFRVRKKERDGVLREERKRLERTMKLHVAAIQQELSRGLNLSSQGLLRDVIFEKESLRAQNLTLSQLIQGHQALQSVLANGSRQEDSLLSSDNEPGWWVHFADGIPSFYFYPLTPEEINGAPNPLDVDFTSELSSSSMTGAFLGWIVHREVIHPTELWGKKISSRVRFTKRIHCSIDTAIQASIVREKELRPILVTPLGWSCSQINKVSTQVLQEIDPQCRVQVHNVPGSTNTRYVFLARTAQWKLTGGRRKMGFSMMIYESKANKLSHEAETPEDVDWVSDGWAYFTLTEVDDSAIDVVYEHSAECQNKPHADFLMVQWAQYVVQWEQIVSTSRLLAPE